MTGKMVVSVTNGLRPVGRQEIDCLFSAGPELLGWGKEEEEGIFMSPFTLVRVVPTTLASLASSFTACGLTGVCHIWQGQSTSILTSLLVQIAAIRVLLDPPPPRLLGRIFIIRFRGQKWLDPLRIIYYILSWTL